MTNNEDGMKKNLTNYGDKGFSIFLRKAFIKGLGYSDEMLDKKIIGITNTFSDYNPCHGNVPDLIKSVRTGILSNGAIPLEFPTITIHESFANPTSMYLRNLMSIDTEEMLKANWTFFSYYILGVKKEQNDFNIQTMNTTFNH